VPPFPESPLLSIYICVDFEFDTVKSVVSTPLKTVVESGYIRRDKDYGRSGLVRVSGKERIQRKIVVHAVHILIRSL
jgi:hypothetical protein